MSSHHQPISAINSSNNDLIESPNAAAHNTSNEKINDIKSLICQSNKLKLEFEVHVQNETQMAHQRCFIMTIHDLGFDYTQFQEFIGSESMTGIRNRVVWLHVNLPGQETEAEDLKLDKYPTLEELADELVCVLDTFKIPQIVCMGEGAGSYISTQFAIKYPNRCLGLVLIEPVVSSASLFESLRFKLNNISLLSNRQQQQHQQATSLSSPLLGTSNQQDNMKSSYIFNRFGKYASSSPSSSSSNSNTNTNYNKAENEPEHIHLENYESNRKFENRNYKNLTLFAESFINRSNLLDKVKEVKVDMLVAVGKNSCAYGEAKKFYRFIQESHKKDPSKLVNSPFLEIDNSTHVLNDSPDKLALSLQYFLQGIGLLSAMPMKTRQGKSSSISSYGRSLSEDADHPSSSSQSDSSASPLVSSNPSICLAD